MNCLVNGIRTFYPYGKIKLDSYLIVYITINSRQIKCLNVKNWYNYFCEETDNNYRDLGIKLDKLMLTAHRKIGTRMLTKHYF